MYTKVENDVYEFNGDFEKFLLNMGVEADHIEKMKKKKLQASKGVYYKRLNNNCETIKLVPLSKVIGTCRGTVGESVFENVRVMHAGEREPIRFQTCFSYFEEMPLDKLKESYKEVIPVEMVYYKEEDEYYLVGDGNHRTLTAMLLGAEYIKASVTEMYCDNDKKNKFLAVETFYRNFRIYEIVHTPIGLKIVFTDENDTDYFAVGVFPMIREESCYEYIEKLSTIIKRDMESVERWKKFPRFIIRILSMISNNKRIIQYIEKSNKYNESSGIIYLYNF